MRRVAIAAVVVLGLVPAATAASAPPKLTVSGKITALKANTVTIHGVRKVTCRVVSVSPRALGFFVGAKAKMTCARGVLKGISRLAVPVVVVVPTTTSPAPAPSASGQVTRPVSEYSLAGSGTIASLDGGTVGFTSGIVCSLGAGAADVASYEVGDRATFRCSGPLPEGVSGGLAVLELVKAGAVVFKLTSIAPAA